jgi:uncharacterized protein YjbI with pentapeptide repeats
MARLHWTGITARRYRKSPGWETQPSKTLWDWLQLLIVPLILLGALAFWNHSETARENHRADQQRQDITLGVYVSKMSNLVLHERLLHSRAGEPVRTAARTITFAALRGLDGDRKAEVVRFLYQARLLRGRSPVVPLNGANLVRARLGHADLPDVTVEGAVFPGANLAGAYLVEANLENAYLANTHLEDALLRSADLKDADLSGAILDGANLTNASVEGAKLASAQFKTSPVSKKNADLEGAVFRDVDLRRADLSYANLTGAILDDADVRGAVFENAILQGASLKGADLRGADFLYAHLGGAILEDANLVHAMNLDLGHYITGLTLELQKQFLDSQEAFLDSLSRDELADFHLTPEKLAGLRKHANAA